MTCEDNPVHGCIPNISPIVVSFEPEPADMALFPLNLAVQEVSKNILIASDQDVQLHLWPPPYKSPDDSIGPSRSTFSWWLSSTVPRFGNRSNTNVPFFTSAVPNGTTTGVLRQHAIRMNSSVKCSNVSHDRFPETCLGNRPFEASFATKKPTTFSIKVCGPGDYGIFPWNLTRERQDISEELFIDLYLLDRESSGATISPDVKNATLYCTANTTRGYFELGNYRNGYSPGPLLDHWPEPADMLENYNDYRALVFNFKIPTREYDSFLCPSYDYV
jgi:hypothetical protein